MKLTKEQYRFLTYLRYLQQQDHSGSISEQWLSKATRVARYKLIAVRESLVEMGLINVRRTSHGYEYRILA